jgi:hypothetical protein
MDKELSNLTIVSDLSMAVTGYSVILQRALKSTQQKS